MAKKERKAVVIIEDAAGIKRSFGNFKEICDIYHLPPGTDRKKLPLDIDVYRIYKVSFKEKHQMDLEHISKLIRGVFKEQLKKVNKVPVRYFKIAYRPAENEWKLRAVMSTSGYFSEMPDIKRILDYINLLIGSTFECTDSGCFEDDDRLTELMFTLKA